jgi:hypothetical protein
MDRVKCTLICLIILSQIPVMGQVLNEKMKGLEPIIAKKWVGEMMSPDGKNAYQVNLCYETLWNGEIIRFSRAIPDIRSFSEGYIYWDKDSDRISVFTVSTRGAARESEVCLEDGKILIKGTLSIDNRTFNYKNTFEFTPDGKMIDRWFQNAFGPWQPGHVIVFSKEITKQ